MSQPDKNVLKDEIGKIISADFMARHASNPTERTAKILLLENLFNNHLQEIIKKIEAEKDDTPFPGIGEGSDMAIRKTCYKQGKNEMIDTAISIIKKEVSDA